MKRLFQAIFLTITIGCAQAQTSHQSGFYPADSIFFTVNWAKTSTQKLIISVNGSTEETFHEYTGGIWLYNRNNTPNTWEDQVFSRNPCSYYFDTLIPRGSLKKVNVVRIRLIDTVTATIKKDSVYNIGIEGIGNTQFPFSIPVSFITVDSLDAFGPQGFYGPGSGNGEVWNYSYDKYGKRANLQIINPETNFFTNQFGEIRIGAGSSSCIANKGISFKGNNDTPFLGPKTITSDIYNGIPTKYKWMKFRVGGSGQRDVFATHEIGLRIIDGLKIGEVPSTPAITFFNGSYWSLAFPQDKPNQYAVERYTGIDKDFVDIFEPIPLDILYDSIVFRNSFLSLYNDGAITYQIPDTLVDTADMVTIQRADQKFQIIGTMDEGTKSIFQPVFQEIINVSSDTISDHFSIYNSLLDLDSWLRYISLIDLMGLRDVITNNVMLAATQENKPMIIMEDMDGAGMWTSPNSNLWEQEIIDADEGYRGIMLHMIRNILLKSPRTINRLLLVWQDLYNTSLLSSRTVSIIESVSSRVMPEYEMFHNSWDPLMTRDSISQESMFNYVKHFFAYRPDAASQILVNRWMTSDSFQLADRKLVRIVMDSIPAGLVSVQFNSLSLDTSFSGLYYPKPALQISYQVDSGFDIYIKEYPDSGKNFQVYADSAITITFLVRPVTLLPVELSSFTCSQGSDGLIVFWQTTSELNNSHFVIERSYNGTVFDSVGFVYGNGTATTANEYSYVDTSDITNTPVYYRLKQVDMDGSIVLSDICMVSLTTTNNHSTAKNFGMFPNPTSGIITITNPELIQEVRITGLLGNDIYYGFNVHNIIDLSSIPSGIYFVTILAKSGQIVTKKILKE